MKTVDWFCSTEIELDGFVNFVSFFQNFHFKVGQKHISAKFKAAILHHLRAKVKNRLTIFIIKIRNL